MLTGHARHGIGQFQFPDGAELVVTSDCVSLFNGVNYYRPLAGWVDADAMIPGKAWLHAAPYPDDLQALVLGVLAGYPPYGLLDWLLEFGPDNLRAELEPRIAAAFN